MNSPIPVLHVINECDDGSISRIVERIIRFSPNGDFRWYVCATRGLFGFEKNFTNLGAQVENAAPGNGQSDSSSQVIQDVIERNQIRIIHSHTPRTIMEVWRAGLKKSAPSSNRPVHMATKHLLTTPQDRNLGLIYTLYDRLSLYPPDHIVTVSDKMADQVKSQPGIPSSKVTSIPNSIPVDDFYRPDLRDAYRQKLDFSPEMIVMGFTGRIQKVKNLDFLIKAFAILAPRYPNLRLALAGDGDMLPMLQNLAETLGIPHLIKWVGFCNEIPGFLSAVDLYIQPSVNEGLSLSILEAMASGKSVIATRVGSADEIIEDRVTGLIIEPNRVDQIVDAASALLESSEFRENLAHNGKAHVLQKYNIQNMVDDYTKLYLKLDGFRG